MSPADLDTAVPEQDEEKLPDIMGEALEDPDLYKKPPSRIVVGDLMENLDWTFGGDKNGPLAIQLHAPGDQAATSQALTELAPGEYFVLKFQVECFEQEGEYARSLQFLLVEDGFESGWACTFPDGMDFMLGGGLYLNNEFFPLDLDFSSYLPGDENTAVFAYDGDSQQIQFILNGELLPNWIVVGEVTPRRLKVRVTGLRVELLGN